MVVLVPCNIEMVIKHIDGIDANKRVILVASDYRATKPQNPTMDKGRHDWIVDGKNKNEPEYILKLGVLKPGPYKIGIRGGFNAAIEKPLVLHYSGSVRYRLDIITHN